jgi:hypothetical protein
MGKEASAGYFLPISGGEREREGVVPVPHIGDGRPTSCWYGEDVAQHCSPVQGLTHAWRSRFEADPDHCSTGSGPNH